MTFNHYRPSTSTMIWKVLDCHVVPAAAGTFRNDDTYFNTPFRRSKRAWNKSSGAQGS